MVLNLRRAFHTKSKVCFEFEPFEGVLFSEVKRGHSIFKEKHVTRIIAEIIVALGQLHESGLVLVNLEPKRFMVLNSGHVLIHDLSFSCPKGRSLSS